MDKGGIFLPKKLPIFYSALLLTGVNLLLRLVGTSFQVYLSGRIGAAGIGLLQLVLSVGSFAMVAGIAGVRTAAMYLTAEELGKKEPENVTGILSACFLYSILCSGAAALFLFTMSPLLAEHWIGTPDTVPALRLLAAFLPASCLCAVMTGYFTAENKIGTLAAVEVCEQLCSMGITMLALKLWAGTDAGRACQCVIFGSCISGCLTLCTLVLLRNRERPKNGASYPIRKRLLRAAVPLALADILKSGISTLENLMVPRRLAENPAIADPLASFGTVCGMVFPILMFPACILFGLAELLIPELARCAAAGSKARISYLTRRGLKMALLYGITLSGLMYLLAETLCLRFYGSPEAGRHLRLYAPLVPMLYCDAITDAMTKGLGQQKACVRYNILTSAMDVTFLYILLPKYGMEGYFFSFLITHMVNFILSLRRLLRITEEHLAAHIPMLALSSSLAALWAAQQLPTTSAQCVVFLITLFCLLTLTQVCRKEDFLWFSRLITAKNVRKASQPDTA